MHISTHAKESVLTRKIKKHLETFEPNDLYFWKTSDRYKSGLPDITLCYRGQFIAIEIKREGELPRKLQQHVINQINKAGGIAFSVNDYEDYLTKLNDAFCNSR